MRARQDPIKLFSSFIQFEGDRFHTWLRDPRLQRNMQRCYEKAAVPKFLERYWALHWHKQWQQQPQSIARDHLLAYLQEACYWVAYKSKSRFSSTQYGLADCFQLAIAQFEKVLKGFNSNHGFDLKNYASATFRSLIRDYLRQRQEVDICTDWSLLRKVSQKRLAAALQTRGLNPHQIERYLLAWRAYNLIYVPDQATGTRRLAVPEPQTWNAISQHYNHERHSLSGEAKTVSPQHIEAWLTTAAKAVRSYLYPRAVSVNATGPGQDAGEFIDSLTDDERGSPITELISAEEQTQRQQQYTQLEQVLSTVVAGLPPEAQQLLTLYYGADVTQTEIAEQMGIQQYAISRKLTRIKKTLLLALSQWAQDTLHISPSPDLVNQSSAALEAWLLAQYSINGDELDPLQPVTSANPSRPGDTLPS